MTSDDIQWERSYHRQRRYDLYVSKCHRYYKKATSLPKKVSLLETEMTCLSFAKELGLNKIQELVSSGCSEDGGFYIITKFCGLNITRRKLPADWSEQLDEMDRQVDRLRVEKQVYHNDIQVRNIFVDLTGALTLIDFDLGSIGKPTGRAVRHPELNSCMKVRDRITNRWGVE